jgi:NADPH-dependent glutamate synthase beta subunit-like oxidoreductase
MTPIMDLTWEKGAGPIRVRRPVYVDLLPPCNDACPAGENIQAWLDLAQAGKYRQAWEALVRDNPMPAVHGRVCYHPCETACNRGTLDAPVSIHAIERFLGDLASQQGWSFKVESAPSGKRVLVVGGGPCGLSAAYHLARLGHSVEIHEAGPLAGGMMHFGIPAYRLSRADLKREIARIEAMGVKFITNHRVADVLAEQAAGGFGAVFIAIGADEALIVYRRDRAHMPAHAVETDEAIEEGLKIKWLTTIKEIVGPDLTVEMMELDAQGQGQATGRFETLKADAIVLALGQESDSEFLRHVPHVEFTSDGAVKVGPDMMTGHPGIFAGGDVVPGERSVTAAVGHGKRAARHMDAWPRGARLPQSLKHAPVSFDMLHLPVYSDAEPRVQRTRTLPKRLSDFGEVVAGLQEKEARYEAQRCLSCGNCYECD